MYHCLYHRKVFFCSGYEIEEHDNPPDFFLDVIIGDCVSQTSTDDDVPMLQGKITATLNHIR